MLTKAKMIINDNQSYLTKLVGGIFLWYKCPCYVNDISRNYFVRYFFSTSDIGLIYSFFILNINNKCTANFMTRADFTVHFPPAHCTQAQHAEKTSSCQVTRVTVCMFTCVPYTSQLDLYIMYVLLYSIELVY